MTCQKTGCHIFIEPYGEYAYGDAFVEDFTTGEDRGWAPVYWFRICDRSRTPLSPTLHYTIHDFHDWFDKDKSSTIQNSTMIATDVEYHGYEGKTL